MNIGYLKRFMSETGFLLTSSPGLAWSLPEENAWRQVCLIIGARFTPYPDRQGQDPDFLNKVDTETLFIERATPEQQGFIDLKQLLPDPIPLAEGTPARFARVFKTVTQAQLPKRRERTITDPLQGLSPNIIEEKIPEKKPARFASDKSRRLKALREDPEPPNTGSGPIRVR